jgi:4-hydroxythreonine-4-phosphate dehydrogenase
MTTRPRIALTLGDPAGIGPEVSLAAMRDPRVRGEMDLVALGPGTLRPREVPFAAPDGARGSSALEWIDTGGPERWDLGRPQKECGEAALAALRRGAELATARLVDALVTAPVSKEALHLAGERVEGQTELLGRWAGVHDFEMLAVAGRLRVMLLSRHMPLRAALELVEPVRVVRHLELLHRALQRLGFERPRLALAGLNPHAGEGGLLGSEELDLLEPALARARSQRLDVAGPISPDAVFLQALRGRYDGVLALYHDQAFIPVKLAAPDRGLTVIAGLPYLRVSPAHGTAFDIAGKKIASAANLVLALRQAAAWASGRTGELGE